MSKEDERISARIACLDIRNMPATLVPAFGYHCEVWRSTGIMVREGTRIPIDVVIKRHFEPCSLREVQVLYSEYQELKNRLEEMIPSALYVSTRINGVDNVVVIAEAANPWFNIANPANEEETIPLLRQLSRARNQLRRFVEAARFWHQEQDRIIDLYGLDNLILDVSREVRYIDSFGVFFYGDLLYALDEVDQTVQDKIELSLQRRDYLEYVIRESKIVRIPGMHF